MKFDLDHSNLCRGIRMNSFYKTYGKIEQIVGMTVEASGINCNIGDVCKISVKPGKKYVTAEVVGFKDGKVMLMPYSDMDGIGYGSFPTHNQMSLIRNLLRQSSDHIL